MSTYWTGTISGNVTLLTSCEITAADLCPDIDEACIKAEKKMLTELRSKYPNLDIDGDVTVDGSEPNA